MRQVVLLLGCVLFGCNRAALAESAQAPSVPLFRVVDLALGESATVELTNAKKATVRLLKLNETRDSLRSAVRRAEVEVEVNGQRVPLLSGMYNLPVTQAGVQIDCTATRGLLVDTSADSWGLVKDARLRLWPEGSTWFEAGSFVYPVRQLWFASGTQMANEPAHVDGDEIPAKRRIYYHSGLDLGGAEGMVDVVSATDGLVISSGPNILSGHDGTPAKARYDTVYILDDHGWYYRYTHLFSIERDLRPGQRVKAGQKLGLLGKEGDSGGWAHLHFEIKSRQPAGQWGAEEGYAFLWEAYAREHAPAITAVARPHHFTWAGDPVVLDGSLSRCRSGSVARCDWTFTDGQTAAGARVERTYSRAGLYSEVLKVTDEKGNTAFDFATVQVMDKVHPDDLIPTIQAAYAPTLKIRPGDPVTFKVRTFRTTDGQETWTFGDGTPPVSVHSDGNVQPLAKDGFAVTVHKFAEPGDYIVRVERTNRLGQQAIAHLLVHVGTGD